MNIKEKNINLILLIFFHRKMTSNDRVNVAISMALLNHNHQLCCDEKFFKRKEPKKLDFKYAVWK